MEKVEKLTIAKYYLELLAVLRKDSKVAIFDTADFYKEVDELDRKYNITTTQPSVRRCNVLTIFKKFFKEYLEEAPDSTYKGKGKRFIYSLEVSPDKVLGLEKKLLNDFSGARRMIVTSKEKETGTSTASTVSTSSEVDFKKSTIDKKSAKKVKKLRQDFCKKFMKLLTTAYGNDGLVDISVVKTIMQYKSIPSIYRIIEDWKKSLKRVFIFSLRVSTLDKVTGKVLCFSDVKNTIKILGEKYKEWYGEDLGADKVLRIAPTTIKREREIKSPYSTGKKITYEIAHAIFIIGGLCKLESKLISFDNLYSTLKDKFSLDCPRDKVIRLVKDYGFEWLELNTTTNPGVIAKRDADWSKFIEEFGPKNYSRVVVSRLGMTIEELNKFGFEYIKFEVLSKITESDAIYKIVFDRSEHSMRDLCRLVRSFRGVDQIFDDELVDKIIFLNNQIDSSSFAGNLGYEIESDLK